MSLFIEEIILIAVFGSFDCIMVIYQEANLLKSAGQTTLMILNLSNKIHGCYSKTSFKTASDLISPAISRCIL
jgi:hypothetical protein